MNSKYTPHPFYRLIDPTKSKEVFYESIGISSFLVAERLRNRSREQKVPSSSPHSDISVEMTSQC